MKRARGRGQTLGTAARRSRRRGRTEAFSRPELKQLLESRQQLVASLARWLGDAEEAEDVMQDAYLKALTTASNVRDQDRVLPWFRRLLRNTAIDRMRRRRSDRRARSAWAREVRPQLPAPDDVEDAVCKCCHEVLIRLRPSHAEVVRRVDLEGLDVAAVAKETGATPNNVRVRLHRARAALRAQLFAVCGLCAQHGCLECSCRRSPNN